MRTPDQLAALQRNSDALLHAGLAERTRRVMAARWERWTAFLAAQPYSVDPRAAPEAEWCLFATSLAQARP